MRLRPAASWQAIQQGMAVTSPKPISERGIPAWSEQGTYAQQECGVSYFQTNPFLTHTHTQNFDMDISVYLQHPRSPSSY